MPFIGSGLWWSAARILDRIHDQEPERGHDHKEWTDHCPGTGFNRDRCHGDWS